MIKVYHADDETRRDATFLNGGAFLARFAAGRYELAAVVESDDLEEAWRLTNSIARPWIENPGVTAQRTKVRSSCVGDIFETVDGTRYVVAGMGFVRLPGKEARES